MKDSLWSAHLGKSETRFEKFENRKLHNEWNKIFRFSEFWEIFHVMNDLWWEKRNLLWSMSDAHPDIFKLEKTINFKSSQLCSWNPKFYVNHTLSIKSFLGIFAYLGYRYFLKCSRMASYLPTQRTMHISSWILILEAIVDWRNFWDVMSL